ncbi:MAG: hypothetical protein WDW38_006387 [Sanguina aurantia]
MVERDPGTTSRRHLCYALVTHPHPIEVHRFPTFECDDRSFSIFIPGEHEVWCSLCSEKLRSEALGWIMTNTHLTYPCQPGIHCLPCMTSLWTQLLQPPIPNDSLRHSMLSTCTLRKVTFAFKDVVDCARLRAAFGALKMAVTDGLIRRADVRVRALGPAAPHLPREIVSIIADLSITL